jgi:hypothetical protein
MEIQKNEEKIKKGEKTKKLKRKQQGVDIHEDVAFDTTLLKAIPLAISNISANWFEGMAPDSFVFEAQQCETCMENLNEEVTVPKQLQQLYDILVHHHVGSRIIYTSKN